MKPTTILLSILALAATLASTPAQTNNIPEPPSIPPELTPDLSATNWCVIPAAVILLDPKPQLGIGVAGLYSVSPNFWAGFRLQRAGGMDVTAAVQGQLQITKRIFGVSVSPLVETSVGIGKSQLWGSAGAGGHVHFKQWLLGSNKDKVLSVGGLAIWEHYVMGSRNGNELIVGPTVRYSF